MEEEWRYIKGYEGNYQISTLGRVKSFYKKDVLKPGKLRDGYLIVGLYKEGKRKHYKVHKLVAEAFIPNPNNYKEINHKDENKSNNCVSNLEWCTHKYNINYGTRSQRVSESRKGKCKGSKHSQARKVQCITTGKKFNCIQEGADFYYIHRQGISECCRGKRKSAGKHPDTGEKLKWKYLDE